MSYLAALTGVFVVLGVILLCFLAAAYFLRRFIDGRAKRPARLLGFLIRYVLVFGLLLGLESFTLWLFPSVHQTLRDSVADIVGGIMHLAGTDALVAGSVISIGSPATVFDISAACLGGLLLWVYLALVIAEPRASRRQRLKGILVGLAILFAFNIFRIATSVHFEGTKGLHVHDWFYLVNMIVVLVVWAGWVRTLKKAASATTKPGY